MNQRLIEALREIQRHAARAIGTDANADKELGVIYELAESALDSMRTADTAVVIESEK